MAFTFNTRYKPKTTREYTKSDLTVYDSAGNTALNTLKVYGKSEIVDGVIKSAGEGYAVVRLADLSWRATDIQGLFFASIANMKKSTTLAERHKNAICSKYPPSYDVNWANISNYSWLKVDYTLGIKDTNYNSVEDFVSSLGDTTLCYQLADPTQGNTIAIKTDNGTGINGTMAVFETGAPLYGVSDTVRDVMVWDGSAGTVTKVCASVDLGTRIWTEYGSTTEYTRYVTGGIDDKAKNNGNCLCAKYNPKLPTQSIEPNMVWINNGNAKLSITTNVNEYASATDFKTAMSGVMLVYELATPVVEQLTQTENDTIASLRTFNGTTHFTNNANTHMTVNYTIKVPTI